MRHNFRKSNFNRRAYRPLRQRNFADREGNNLVEKCRIINRNLFSNERNYLSPEELIKFFEMCRETWTCRNTSGAVHACNHLINVLEYYTGKSDVRPTSVAVYEPSMLVESSTVPEILIGKQEPFDIVGSVRSCAEGVAESFFDDQYQMGVLNDDTQSAYMDNDESFLDRVEYDVRGAIFQAVKELADEEASFVNLVGNDSLLTDFNPEDYMDLEYDEVNQEEDPRLIELFEELYSKVADEKNAFCDAYENARYKFTNSLRYNKYDSEYDEKKVDELVDLAKQEGIEEAVNSLDPKYDLDVLTGEQRLKHYELKNHLSDWEIVDSEESDKYFYDTIRAEITKRMSWSNFAYSEKWMRRNISKSDQIACDDQLISAAGNGDIGQMRLWIERGAKVNPKYSSYSNDTPLHWAAGRGRIEAVLFLLKKRARVDAKNTLGETPLFEAAEHGNLGVVKLLVERGADINCRSRSGATPLDEAEYYGHTDTAAYLKSIGAENGNLKERMKDLLAGKRNFSRRRHL